MTITYVVIVAIVTYCFGAITKTFIDVIPNKYIPAQNVLIGLLSAAICIYFKIETDIAQAFVLCIVAATGAGGIQDLINKNNYKPARMKRRVKYGK
ncbi:MAG: holin [Bacillota bacterium]|nr:holin [Bacillota bacterium]